MKKLVVAAISAILLSGCGVGTYSVTSGKADEGSLSFTSADKTPITVTVDDATYDIVCVKEKTWKRDRDIKQTAKNTIIVTPGSHAVKVTVNGNEIYSRTLFISASEHKVIEL